MRPLRRSATHIRHCLVDDVFIHNTANYKFCGIDILPSFSSYDMMKAPDIANDMVRLRKHLGELL